MLEGLLLTGLSDPDANAWANAVQGAGGFVTGPQRRRVATLIRSLKAAGVWPLLDRLWLFAAENNVQAGIDLVARASVTLVAAPAFTVARGYKGGSGAYINTNFNPGTGSPNFSRNSGGYGCWVEAVDTSAGDRIMGNDSALASELFVGATNYGYGVSQASNSTSMTPTYTTGAMDSVRVASSGTGAVSFYVNGALSASDSIASVAVANQSFFVLASNNGGSPPKSTIRAADCWIGGGMSAALIAALKVARRTYMTAVGVA